MGFHDLGRFVLANGMPYPALRRVISEVERDRQVAPSVRLDPSLPPNRIEFRLPHPRAVSLYARFFHEHVFPEFPIVQPPLTPWSEGDMMTSHTDHHPQGVPTTTIDELQLRILDVLIEEGGYWTAEPGQVLTSLATRIHGEPVSVGERRYHQVSLAVLRLEGLEFLLVERAYRDEAEKANVLLALRLR